MTLTTLVTLVSVQLCNFARETIQIVFACLDMNCNAASGTAFTYSGRSEPAAGFARASL